MALAWQPRATETAGGPGGAKVARCPVLRWWDDLDGPRDADRRRPVLIGIFSIAFRDRSHGVAVGGDFQYPDRGGRIAARTTDGGRTWELAAGQHHGRIDPLPLTSPRTRSRPSSRSAPRAPMSPRTTDGAGSAERPRSPCGRQRRGCLSVGGRRIRTDRSHQTRVGSSRAAANWPAQTSAEPERPWRIGLDTCSSPAGWPSSPSARSSIDWLPGRLRARGRRHADHRGGPDDAPMGRPTSRGLRGH